MRTAIKVNLENGQSFMTEINGSKQEIVNYYVGRYFNVGGENDVLVKCISVEFVI